MQEDNGSLRILETVEFNELSAKDKRRTIREFFERR